MQASTLRDKVRRHLHRPHIRPIKAVSAGSFLAASALEHFAIAGAFCAILMAVHVLTWVVSD